MVTVRKNKRGRNRWVSGDPILHVNRKVGPLVYVDREWLGVRVRCVWLFGRKLKSWRVS